MIDRLGQLVRNGAWNSGATLGNTVTCGAAHTKGAWVELTSAALDAPSGAIILSISNPSSVDSYLVDIGYGASDAAVFVAIPHLQFRVATNNGCEVSHWPLYVPAGMKLYARCQSPTAGATLEIYAATIGGGSLQDDRGGLWVPRVWRAFGPSLANSLAATIDPGATPHSWGSWTTLAPVAVGDAPNSGRIYKWAALSVHHPSIGSRFSFGLELAWHGGGATQPQTPIRLFFDNFYTFRRAAICPALPVRIKDVASGALFRARAQSSTSNLADRVLVVGLYLAE